MLDPILSRVPGGERLRAFLERHRRHVPAAALALGFIWDTLTLGRPDRIFDNSVLLAYFTIAAGGMVVMNLRVRRGAEPESISLLGLVQFAFGSIASGLLVLYGHSGTFAGSLLFFLLLGGFLIGNEFLRTRYARLRAQVAAFYMLLLAYVVLIVPVLAGAIGVWIFIVSGLVSLLLIAGFVGLLYAVGKRVVVPNLRAIGISVTAIYVVFNILYFTNILPPVPLALRQVDIYHRILREGTSYTVEYEKAGLLDLFRETSPTFTKAPGESAYCFSSVFAPSGLSSPIFHRWEYLDPEKNEWRTEFRISFTIEGGSDTGFRGYTAKTALEDGLWRCNVETERGALIGRTTFRVVSASSTPPLTEGRL